MICHATEDLIDVVAVHCMALGKKKDIKFLDWRLHSLPDISETIDFYGIFQLFAIKPAEVRSHISHFVSV